MQVQQIEQQLLTVVADAAALENDPNRPPSPPIYDAAGVRTNTREVRMRAQLMKDRGTLYEKILAINPAFRCPTDFKRARPELKLYIPQKEYPGCATRRRRGLDPRLSCLTPERAEYAGTISSGRSSARAATRKRRWRKRPAAASSFVARAR